MAMSKTEELVNPNSCFNKAAADEPIFVLRGKDERAAVVIRFWCHERIAVGKNQPGDPQITEALALADAMETYQRILRTTESFARG